MRKVFELADLCWDGLTLKHVSHKEIVVPYVLFIFLAFIFELLLSFLFIFSFFLFMTYGYKPNIPYYISGAILILMLIMTVPLVIGFLRIINSKLARMFN